MASPSSSFLFSAPPPYFQLHAGREEESSSAGSFYAVLNKAAPPSVTPSSNSTKSSKAPSLDPQRLLPNCHHRKTRHHLPSHHQTNLSPRVLVNPPPPQASINFIYHTVYRYERCFLELSRPQTKMAGATKLFARKSS